MIATDIASRGLDFNNVDWVVQLDSPADVDDYIHRVGRTARMNNRGKALLVLTPSQEKPFVTLLEARNVPVAKVEVSGLSHDCLKLDCMEANVYFKVNTDELVDIRRNLSNLMVPFPQLKQFAQGVSLTNTLTCIRLTQLKIFLFLQSFVAYARAISFMKLKTVFDVRKINFEELARSLLNFESH